MLASVLAETCISVRPWFLGDGPSGFLGVHGIFLGAAAITRPAAFLMFLATAALKRASFTLLWRSEGLLAPAPAAKAGDGAPGGST